MFTTHCINNETWTLYAANKLAAKELAILQKHAKTCELCSDVKDGIDAMPNPALLSQKVAILNQKAEEYLTPKKTKKIALWYWSAAAVLLLSVGIGWMYTKTNFTDKLAVKTNPTVEKMAKDTLTKIQAKKKQVEIIPKKNVVPKKEKTKLTTQSENTETNHKNATEIEPLKFKSTDFNNDYEFLEKADKENIPYTPAPNTEIIDTAAKWRVMSTRSNKDMATRSSRKERELPVAVLNNYFSNSNITIENSSFNRDAMTLITDSLNYYEALQNFNKKLFAICITNLDSVIVNTNSIFYEKAMLLKAKIYIKQKKNKKAKELLNAVLLINGNHKKEAEKLLNTLK